MKRHETSQAVVMHCKCHYSHIVIGTYNMVLSCHFQRQYCKNLSFPIILKGNLKEKGSQFIIKRPDLNLYIFYEIKELIITDYYARFKYHIYKTIPETYEYDYILEIRYINEDECNFLVSFIFDHKIYLSEKEMYEEIKFKKILYKNITRALRNSGILKIASVYTTINCKIELIIDILKNMKIINKYAHLLGDKIDYEGKILKKNSLINLIEFNEKEVYKSIAKVQNCFLNKSEISKEYVIELVFDKGKNSVSDLAKAKIKILVYEYNGICSIYALYYFFNIQRKELFLYYFKEDKQKELIKLKNIVENYSQKKSF